MTWDEFINLRPGDIVWKFHASQLRWVPLIVISLKVHNKYGGRPDTMSLRIWSPRSGLQSMPWRIERQVEHHNWSLDPPQVNATIEY